ncbi:hypothetical protein NMY22_g1593 [Coprinellus aureogranulatus]|nr:hypothetical protein NMY22_g1593 [Coprinellus aureogranulatus]
MYIRPSPLGSTHLTQQQLLTSLASESTLTQIDALDAFFCSTPEAESSSTALKPGDVVEVQGPTASGKTHLVYHLITTCVLPALHGTVKLHGWQKAAIVFDTDGSFDIRRLRQLMIHRLQGLVSCTEVSPVVEQCLQRIALIRVNSTTQLAVSINNSPTYLARLFPDLEFGLLVVDSLSTFYWPDRFAAESGGPSMHTLSKISNRFRSVVTALQAIRSAFCPVIVLTNWGLASTRNAAGPSISYRQHLHPWLDPFSSRKDASGQPEYGIPDITLPTIRSHITTAMDAGGHCRFSAFLRSPGSESVGRMEFRRYDAGSGTLSALSMLKTLSLARRPSLKLLLTPGCSIINSCSRLRHGLSLQPSATVDTAGRIPRRAPAATTHSQQPCKLLPLPESKLQRLQTILRKHPNKHKAVRAIQGDRQLAEYFTRPSSIQSAIRQMCGSSTPEYVVDLVDLSNLMGYTVDRPAFEMLCVQASTSRNWNLVLKLADKGVSETGASEQLLWWRYRALAYKLNFRWLHTVLQDFAEAGIHPTRMTFHLMLTAALQNLDVAQAQHVIKIMKEHGVPPDATTHTLIARLHRKVGSDDNVEENAIASLHEVAPSYQVAALNSLIRRHMENGAVQRAVRLLSLFAPESVETIIEVLYGSGGAGEMADPTSYPEPLPNPPRADATLYAVFITWCSHKRNLSGALQLLQSMITSGIPMSESTIVSLVETCFTCRRPDLAIQLVAGVCDPTTTPSTLFLPLHPEPWPEHRFEIHVPDMQPTQRVFNALLRGVLQYHGLSGAKHVLHIMEKNGVFPNRTTLTFLLGHMLTVQRSRPRTMIRVLYTLTSADLLPTQDHVGFVVRCIQREEDYLLHGRGWEKLKFGLGGGEVPKAKQVRTSPDFESFAGMVLPTFRGYRALMEPFFEDIRYRGVKPNAKTICLRIRHEAVINMDMDTAYDVFETMLARGITATYGRRGDPAGGLRAFGKMVDAGIQPDVPSIDAVAANFYALGKNTMAKKVLIKLWPYVGKFPEHLTEATVLDLAKHFRTLHTRQRNANQVVSNERQKQIHLELVELLRVWQNMEVNLGKVAEAKQEWSRIKSAVSSEWDPLPEGDIEERQVNTSSSTGVENTLR